jgi:hypothetical protein
MKNVDFSQCELHDTSFTHGIDLSNCRFPNDKNYILVKDLKKVYGKVKQVIAETWEDPDRAVYLRIIDQAYFEKSRQNQQMDLLDCRPQHKEDKRFFELIKRINDSV